MSSVIKFNLSSTCQASLAREGRVVPRSHVLTLPPELFARALDLGATIHGNGMVELDAAFGAKTFDRLPASATEALDYLEAQKVVEDEQAAIRATEQAAAEAKRNAEIVERAAKELERWTASVMAYEAGGSSTYRPSIPYEQKELRARVEAEDERRATAEILAKAELKAAVNTWLLAGGAATLRAPLLERAAREDRDCSGEVKKIVRARLTEACRTLAESVRCHGPEKVYAYETFVGVPHERTYALVDALTAALPELVGMIALPDAKVEVDEIERNDVAEHGSAVWRLGMDVVASHPWLGDDVVVTCLVDSPWS